MKQYQLTELANKLVQAKEPFDVNVTSPNQIDVLEEHFGKVEEGTGYKRATAFTFSYYSSSSNALYTITDPDTPRYEFGDLLKDADVDEVLSPVDFIRKYSKVTPSNVVTHQELKESIQGSTTFPGRVSGKNGMEPVIELMENGWGLGADFVMFWTVYQAQLLSGAITFRFESQEEAMLLWLELGGICNE